MFGKQFSNIHANLRLVISFLICSIFFSTASERNSRLFMSGRLVTKWFSGTVTLSCRQTNDAVLAALPFAAANRMAINAMIEIFIKANRVCCCLAVIFDKVRIKI